MKVDNITNANPKVNLAHLTQIRNRDANPFISFLATVFDG
jgi:hypothetical protein